jgi:hypothetical protein
VDAKESLLERLRCSDLTIGRANPWGDDTGDGTGVARPDDRERWKLDRDAWRYYLPLSRNSQRSPVTWTRRFGRLGEDELKKESSFSVKGCRTEMKSG